MRSDETPEQPCPAEPPCGVRTVVCIDPGASGAIAILDPQGALVAVRDMPPVEISVNRKPRPRVSAAGIVALLRGYSIGHVYVERVGSTTGEGAAGAFAFGVSCGVVEGVLATLGLPHTLITPQMWKRAARLTADKEQSRQRTLQLWPAHAAMFARKRDADRAEAALLAYHGLLIRNT